MKKSFLLTITFLVIIVFSNFLFAQTAEEYYRRATIFYFEKKDGGKALETLKKALEIDPTHLQSLILYRQITGLEYEKELSQEQYDWLANVSNHLFTQSANEYYFKATIFYFDKKDTESTLECLKKALEIDPTHLQSLILYKEITGEDFEFRKKVDEKKPEREITDLETVKSPKKVDVSSLPEEPEKEVKSAREKVEERRTKRVEIKEEKELKEEKEESITEETLKKEVIVETKKEVLSLYDCLEMALKRAPSLLRQEREVEISQHRIMEEKGKQLPSLNLDLAYIRTSEEIEPEYLTEDYSAFLNLYYEIYPGAIRSTRTRLTQAQDTISIEKNRYMEIRKTVINHVATIFYTILEREETIRITMETISKIEEHLKNVQKMYDLGLKPKIEVLRTEDALQSSKRNLRDLQLDLEIARIKMSRFIGDEYNREIELVDSRIYPEDIGSMTHCIEQALRQRTEIERVKRSLSVAKHNEEITQMKRHPTLSFSAYYGFIGKDVPPDREAYRVSLLLGIPLFDGGIKKAQILQHQNLVSQKEIEINELSQTIEEEIRVVYARFMNSLNQLEVLKKEIEQRKKELSLTKTRYHVGLGTYEDVITTIYLLGDIQKIYVAMKYTTMLNKLILIQSMGLDPFEEYIKGGSLSDKK